MANDPIDLRHDRRQWLKTSANRGAACVKMIAASRATFTSIDTSRARFSGRW